MKINQLKIIEVFILGSICFLLLAIPVYSAERMAVVKSIANIRDGAGTKHKVLWQVEKYHPFLVLKKQNDWYEVKDYEGDVAWIHKSLLGEVSTVITANEPKTKCNVRSEPSKNGRIVLKVERGVPFKVLSRKGNWIRIEHADGETGWIYKTLVW